MTTSKIHEPTLSLNRLAVQATTHRLTGCAIGEILGLVEWLADFTRSRPCSDARVALIADQD
jgi:hypothetical protein